MLVSALLIWFIAFVLFFIVYFKNKENISQALSISYDQLIVILPRLPFSLLAAGFITVLLPEQIISGWIGSDSGFIGVLIAAIIGAFVPSGPIVAFPVAIAFYKLGAGYPQLVAFLTGWSSFQITRMLMWEIPFLGWGFAYRRIIISIPLPLVAGGISMLLTFIYF
ncbi:MAG: hypothetical protein CMM49_01315 [Rhodospirillaceae bacterium]|nr:hypothetical protein [Rhodospirillaceae bacterium]|tara:strand:+ start:742 stop:1239 length:498 start_codon:yes stop_codon:yes gene_type:complete